MNTKKKPQSLTQLGDIRKPEREEPVPISKVKKKAIEPVIPITTRVSVSIHQKLNEYAEREGLTIRQVIETAISRL